MSAFLVSVGVVALAEIGDKTMLLALVLAARYRAPAAVAAGILCATLANHAAAGAAGSWLVALLADPWQRWLIAGSFLAPSTVAARKGNCSPAYGVDPCSTSSITASE